MKLKSCLTICVCSALFYTAHASETTIYETKDTEGISSFTNIPDDNPSAKKIVIDDTAPATNPTSQAQQNNSATNQQITGPTNQQDTQLQQLKENWENALANQHAAEENLAQARKSMEDGTYTVGGDKFIDTDYIHHLEESVGLAKQQTAAAENKYNTYRNSLK